MYKRCDFNSSTVTGTSHLCVYNCDVTGGHMTSDITGSHMTSVKMRLSNKAGMTGQICEIAVD